MSDLTELEKIYFTPEGVGISTNFGQCYYFNFLGFTIVHIGINTLTANTSYTIYQLPSGYRPNNYECAVGTNQGITGYGIVQIGSNGNILVYSTGTAICANVFYLTAN